MPKPAPPAPAPAKRKARSNGKHPGGAPPKLDEPTLARIKAALSVGAPKETAAMIGGIHRSTLYDWLRQGTEALRKAGWVLADVPAEARPYAQFSDMLEKAVAEAEANALTVIGVAARGRPARTVTRKLPDGSTVTEASEAIHGQWQAAAWMLERTQPDRYGRRDRVQHEGVKGGAPIVVEKVDVLAIKQVAQRDDDAGGPG